LPLRWQSRIAAWQPPARFVDEQTRGPYIKWVHEHTFEATGGGTLCRDTVHYVVPGGPLAPLIHRAFVKRDLNRIFGYRHRVLLDIFETGEHLELIDRSAA
jgi:ligand-binding SRPBCC domain-containing protein